MARIAVVGTLPNVEEAFTRIRQIAGHSLRLSMHRPGERVRADLLLMDDTAFRSYSSATIDQSEPTSVIVATRDPSDCTMLLDEGASAVIALPIDIPEIISAVFAIISPGRYLSRRVVAALTARPNVEGIRSTELSPREFDVLTHLSAGLPDAEIADALYLAQATVHTHILNLRRKLGARNRTHAVTLAIQYGLITPSC